MQRLASNRLASARATRDGVHYSRYISYTSRHISETTTCIPPSIVPLVVDAWALNLCHQFNIIHTLRKVLGHQVQSDTYIPETMTQIRGTFYPPRGPVTP